MSEKKEPKIELSAEAFREVYKEQSEFLKSIMDYKLPKVLEDVSQPLTFGEKRELKKYNLKKIEEVDDEDFDELLSDLLDARGVEDIDDLAFSDLQMWLRRVVMTTFNIKAIAKKK